MAEQAGKNNFSPNSTNSYSVLRAVEDVEGALKVFEEAKCDGCMRGTDAYRNPSFNMITVDASNRCSLALPNGSRISRRQDGKRFMT